MVQFILMPRNWTISWRAVSEFFGTLLFQLLAGSTNDPLAIAFSFAAVQYAYKYASGGHLNPAVSLAAAGSGHIHLHTGLTYAVVQFLGAILGALWQAFLVPDSAIGRPGIGCIEPGNDINGWQLFGWEFVLALLFILVEYSALFIVPGHGDVAPLTSGIALYAILQSVGDRTGYSPVNPARTFASSLVFRCWDSAWIYLLAQLLAAVVASVWVVSYWGKGEYLSLGVHEEEGRARLGTRYEEALLPSAEAGGAGPSSGVAGRVHRDLTFTPEGLIRRMGLEESPEELQEGAPAPVLRTSSA